MGPSHHLASWRAMSKRPRRLRHVDTGAAAHRRFHLALSLNSQRAWLCRCASNCVSCAGPALLSRLAAIERLDLAFLLIDRKHEIVRRRINIAAHHVAQLLNELRINGRLLNCLTLSG